MSYAERDKRDRELVERANARAGGALPVEGFLIAGTGILIGGWYAGWFKGGRQSKEEELVSFLQARNVRVVVFELDGVMAAAQGRPAVPLHEVGEVLDGVSQDFIPAIRALAFHGFKLAAACRGEPGSPGAAPGGRAGRAPSPELVGGADLARLLLSKRLPEVLPHFEIMVGYDARLHGNLPENAGKREHMRRIAKHYGVGPHEMVLFDSCADDLKNEEGWLGVLVRDTKQGFRYDDIQHAAL